MTVRARNAPAHVARWERRPGDRPAELLEAALRVFAAQGYRNATIEQVAAEAGVTKGAVYHHFASKEDLLVRALDHYLEGAFGRLEDALRDAPSDAPTQLRRVLERAAGGDDAQRRDVLLLLQSAAHAVPEVHRRWLAAGPMKMWRLVASIIERGMRAHELRADLDPEAAARLIVGGLVASISWERHGRAVRGLTIDRDRLIDAAIKQLEPPRGGRRGRT